VGKSHLACALGHALVDAGRSVLFTPTYPLVQQLLVARRDLCLPRALRALDVFDAVILDDLGYVQQTGRCLSSPGRRRRAGTSNLVFSEWDRIFKTPMATAARRRHRAEQRGLDGVGARRKERRERVDGGGGGDRPR
jgi:DNA replication protein DnaC